ncbi:RIP metalloprotease RseP [Clostridium aminobutyricum]|uniref:Zinc metalloprotease n=1 Tax=Clostridium aminobutyricum TaxID=33953 RepID=A0A939D6T6_CLOAM|nr:RIP metalloprotease RseP [Clostridium aminobutyricum]MBN7772130.1 RIP metalloprotease RseP [Clostridium aminobutyricum]
MTIIYALIMFCILVMVHEGGHFIAAKSVGVKVNEFAVGMGPILLKKVKGETRYSIRLFPIGGFCAMEGEDDDSDDERSFGRKPLWAKAIIIVAGAFMNLLLAVVILACSIYYIGIPTTVIGEFSEISPAREAGLSVGDKIVAIEQYKIKDWNDITTAISSQTDDTVSITVERDNKALTYTMQLAAEEATGRKIVGITPDVSRSVGSAIVTGGKATWHMTVSMVDVIGQLVTGEVSAKELTGPIGITVAVSDSVKYGFIYVANLAALISLNLAIVNMLPFPALDGGRLVFLIIRKVTGRAITDEIEGRIHFVGIMLLFGLMIYVTWQDIGRFILK